MTNRNCIVERNLKIKIGLILFFVLGVNVIVRAQNWQLINPRYATTDAFVAGYSVRDFGAYGDGMTDVTTIFQQRIDALSALGGGTLFVPDGRYVFRGTLILRKGVTLRGEWRKPIRGESIVGTILMPFAGRANESAAAFITMEPSSDVHDLVFWYPEQQPDNITEYPPTILIGEETYFGNDYCNVKNVTLVNSYSGIIYSRVNSGGSCPVINGIYGTPLSRGIEIDNIADVGRTENIHFSPDYWEGSGLPSAPAAGSAVEKWMASNGTGIIVRRNDWSYTCFATIDGYNKGMHIGPSFTTPGASANGHFYSLTFTRCHTGIYFEATSDVGIMFTKIKISNSTNGIVIGPQVKFPIQFHTCDITATQNALTTDAGSSLKLMMQKSKIYSGQVIISGGTFVASDCDFKDPIRKVIIGSNARVALTGNRFLYPTLFQNNSVLTGVVDNTPLTLPALPVFRDTLSRNQKPSRLVMYNVANAPFNARNDGVTDNTSAIQNALNAASLAGGGVVFLPPGKYKVLGTLTVPTGVELKGSVDIGTAPMGPGSILQVYSGKGNELGTPFIQLSSGSGLRGVVFDYPEQLGDNAPNFFPYPYCIQVTGSNVYIVNVGMRAVYQAIDLFTNPCDNHYLDYVSGSVLKTGVVVGGNSTGGNISNLQFNPQGYAYGSESKWGFWSNAPSPEKRNDIYNYIKDNLIFLTLNNCTNETLYNDFHYGSQSGLILSGASGISLGMGIDGSRKSLVINSLGSSGLDFINTQIVSIDDLPGTCYIETKPGFTSQTTFFNSDYWGFTEYGVSQSAGTLNFQLANFQYPGSTAFANISGGSMSMKNSAVMPVALLLNSGNEPRFSAEASVLDPTGINKLNCALWKNNLSNVSEINPAAALSRTGWTATASVNNGIAGNGIDGNNATRWDTAVPQASGQWYILDMQTNQSFDKIILDAQASAHDWPIAYTVYVSTDGITWTAVASGAGNSGLTVIDMAPQNARYIKIVQTGSSDIFWWSINEYYVLNGAGEPVSGITVAPTSVKLNISATSQLTGTISPSATTSSAVLWTSDNAAVATVSATGLVTAVSVGSAVITIKSIDGSVTATSFVSVSVPVSAVSVLPTSMNLTVGTSQQITPTISPVNATFRNVTWDSNNWTVATVNSEGLVTALAEGSAIIKVKTSDGSKTATTNVSVTNVTAVNEIDIGEPSPIYPNPVSGSAYFDYGLSRESDVNIIVYNAQGLMVGLENKKLGTGVHQIVVNVDDLIPGMYFVRVTSNKVDVTNKIIVIR